MTPPAGFRLLSAAPASRQTSAVYVNPAEASANAPWRSRESLDQYTHLRSLRPGWLDRHDEDALSEVDRFLTYGAAGLPADEVGHDIAIYLCNWVVLNSSGAEWVLDPAGTCFVEVGEHRLDPYRHIVQCVRLRQPVAHRFVQQARALGA